MNEKRGSWGSNIGFLLASIGSAVGLGNIWGFPYKMGKCGGFTFVIVYLALGLFVGLSIMVAELAMGRMTGKGAIGAYRQVNRKFTWLGWMAVISPFIIMSFYTVLGGYCMEYMAYNFSNLAFGLADGTKSGSDLFGAMLTNPFGAWVFTFILILLCYLINRGGISGGIEKFNKVGMPALFVMLVIVIIRSLTLDGAVEGLKYMFVPGYSVDAGFIAPEDAPSLISVLAIAGGQMFFSLSLAMGIMITYGSYLSKKESLAKNSLVIVFADTVVALMAGLAVIPAAVAINGTQANLKGPGLLFITLQDVFNSMGAVGPLFGTVFYLLVIIAAITSIISLIEVVCTYFVDRAEQKGKEYKRPKIVFWVCFAVMVEATIVAIDGLGSNGIYVPFQGTFKALGLSETGIVGSFNDCWLDFIDCLSEGFMMPLGALVMSIMVGWVIKPKFLYTELKDGKTDKWFIPFFSFCIRYIAPLGMLLILAGQINDFFALGWF